MTDLDVVTGELSHGPARRTPAEAAAWAGWVREMKRAVLVDQVDYGTIPGTAKPTLWKSGAEALLLAAGYGATMERLDDTASQLHEGITYRCTVLDGDTVRATCDGYAGYDETRFHYPKGRRADWNTVVKMAQKRAYVGAVLNACAASGLFVADLDDDPRTPPPGPDQAVSRDEQGVLYAAVEALPDHAVDWLTGQGNSAGIPQPAAPAFRRSHRDRLAWMILVAQTMITEATPKQVWDDAPESARYLIVEEQ